MRTNFVNEYIDYLNALDITLNDDNIRFVLKRKNYIFPPDQLGEIVEKCQISLIIDGLDYFFAVVYANPSTKIMKIKYNPHYLDEILMCVGGEFTEFHELGIDDIHTHVWKLNKSYFRELINRLILEQRKEKLENSFV